MATFELQIQALKPVRGYAGKKYRVSEDQLVASLKNMDQGAMSSLYRMYSDSLYKVISTIVHIEEVAQDLLQETFIKIWKSFSQYDPGTVSYTHLTLPTKRIV